MNKQNIFNSFKINENSIVPKYEQIENGIIKAIEQKQILKGDILPSINIAYKQLKISRDTLIIAYKELQNKGIIGSRHGKGFFVTKTNLNYKHRVFLFFDVMNSFKEILYRSLYENLGVKYQVDLFFHYYNIKIFEKIISENIDQYDIFVIMPHFNEDVSKILKKIPSQKLILIDRDVPSLGPEVPAVYQNFEKDVFNALQSGIELLIKYRKINLIINKNFQHIPDGIITGFKKFCDTKKINGLLIENIMDHEVEKNNAYILFTDNDLIELIKKIKKKQLILGKNIGIISYDDTPIKEVLCDGITVISTDFVGMGKTAAQMIKRNLIGKVENPVALIIRNSV